MQEIQRMETLKHLNFRHFVKLQTLDGLFLDFGQVLSTFVLIFFTENFVTRLFGRRTTNVIKKKKILFPPVSCSTANHLKIYHMYPNFNRYSNLEFHNNRIFIQ